MRSAGSLDAGADTGAELYVQADLIARAPRAKGVMNLSRSDFEGSGLHRALTLATNDKPNGQGKMRSTREYTGTTNLSKAE